MTQRWRRAALMPSWIRWLPCAFSYLTVLPERQPFRRSAWDGVVPWDDPAWCDPGGIDEWVTRAQQRHPRREAGRAQAHAREHYDWMLRVRTARIDRFDAVCGRLTLPPPRTVRELFLCLAEFGLFELARDRDGDGDDWVSPQLLRNPLDVLPLSAKELELETRAQRDDRAVLVAIAIRRLAQRTRRRWRRRLVITSVAGLAERAGISVEQTYQSLTDLHETTELVVDVDRPGGWLRLTVPWPDFWLRFPFAELPAPEHAVPPAR